MSDERQAPPRITIDDLAEATADGVLRALQARQIAPTDFTTKNGFFVNVHLTLIAGGPPPNDGTLGNPLTAPGRQLPQ